MADGPTSLDMLRAVRAQLVSSLTVLDAVIASQIEAEAAPEPGPTGMGQDDADA